MRLLHLHRGNQFGVAERVLVTFARMSAGTPGVEHVFGLCFRGRLWNELVAAEGRVDWLGVVRLARPETVLRARHAARRLIAECTPDVVVTHLPWSRVVFGPVLRHVSGRSVHWVHGCSLRSRWLERLAERYPPDACVFNSAFTEATCGARYSGVLSRVVHSPVCPAPAVEPTALVRERFGTGSDEIVIVHASRMEATNGHIDLVEAARLLPAEIPWTIWFAGSPQTSAQRRHYARLQTHVGRSGVAMRVRFLGDLTDWPSVLSASDVFCQPGEVPDAAGIDVVQAMSAGLPVVATALGATPELVTDDAGNLVGVHDPAALAGALEAYLTNAERRAEAGAAGRARALKLGEPSARLAELARFLNQVRGAA